SRQTNRISANVSGFLGTTRIALNDNLLDQCSPSEVLAVLGHEIGHYVMNHVGHMLLEFAFLLATLFALVAYSFRALMKRFGVKWGISSETDPAGLPLMVALFSFFMFWTTPVFNTITRTAEQQADVFGLNAARQPDAFAEVTLKLSTYRKLAPSAFEEFWFYDHPSGRTRILTAMRWKKAHMYDADIASGPISPGQGGAPNSGWK
ncbi:MAG: M48 family metalloprotease, partial [Rhizomicrobium sp.]